MCACVRIHTPVTQKKDSNVVPGVIARGLSLDTVYLLVFANLKRATPSKSGLVTDKPSAN
jgi:hypothetical protein